MPDKVVSIRDVKLQTAAVTLTAIKVGPKQMTLAIFRQLIEEHLIDIETGKLNGLPWGYVNYCPGKKCSMEGNETNNVLQHWHWHIVWQKGKELRRACVAQRPSFDLFYTKSAQNYAEVLIRDIAMGRVTEPMPQIAHTSDIGADEVHLKRSGLALCGGISDEAKALARHCRSARGFPNVLTRCDKEHLQQLVSKLTASLRDRHDGQLPNRDELAQYLDAEVKEELARRERWQQTIRELADLPQLFIAM